MTGRRRWAALALAPLAAGGTNGTQPDAGATSCSLQIGVQTHFGQGWPLREMQLAQDAGAALIRDGVAWMRAEASPGDYRLHAGDAGFLRHAADAGLDAILVFASPNQLYDGGMTPYTDTGRAAFARFVAAVVDAYGAQVRAIEIGNEFNGAFVTGPARQDRAAMYTALLREVHREVKARHPGTFILGGAAHSVPIGWFRDVGAAGAFGYMDGVVVHPYRRSPEGLDREIRRLKAVMRGFGQPLPVFATEFGLETEDLASSPDYLVKMATLMSFAGVCEASWYALRDQEWYRNMGLFDAGGVARPAARAFGIVARELLPHGRARRLSHDALAQVYQFGESGPVVAWGAGHAIALADSAATVRRADGTAIALPPRLDARPVIVTGGGLEVGGTATVADTLYQYGGAPWSYLLQRTGTGERPLEWRDWNWTSYLGDPDFPALAVRQDGVSPAGQDPDPVLAIERFTAPEAGEFVISGRWSSREAPAGDGVRLDVARNGAVIWSRRLANAASAELAGYPVRLSAGDRLDFRVAPLATSRGDAVQRRITITRAGGPDRR